MPIWLRKFTFKEINDFYEAKAAAEKDEMSAGKTSLVIQKVKLIPLNLNKLLNHMKERAAINSCFFSYL